MIYQLVRLGWRRFWLAALIFAVHPVNVATVAWVSEQKNTLSMLFFALSILWYLRFEEENKGYWYGLSLAAFLLALLSKAAVVMLPVVLLGCVWWLRGRLRSRDWLRSAPFFALSILLGFATVWFQHHRALNGQVVRVAGLFSRLAVAGLAPWFYLYKAVLPLDLCMIYPQWDPEGWGWSGWLPGIALAGSFALLWWKRRSWGRPLLFGMGYFVVMLVPVLGFIDQGFYAQSMVADHWQYYSIAGIAALAAAGTVALGRRLHRGQQQVVGPVAGVVVIVLGALSWQRCLVYRDQETLFRDNLLHNPLAWVAHNNLGIALVAQGRMQEGVDQYEEALRIRPGYADAHYNLGNALEKAGRIQDAIGHYEQALRTKPDYPEAHLNLGVALLQAGRVGDAISQYQQAIRIKPDYDEAYSNLGNALLQSGSLTDAIEQYEHALQIKPDFAVAHFNLALALEKTGRMQEAVEHYKQELRTRPNDALAHYNLGVDLFQAGKTQEGMDHVEQATRINPDNADAHSALGIMLTRTSRVNDAIGQFEEALRINPADAATQYNLGLALKQAGRFQEAITHLQEALRLRPDYPEAQAALEQARLQASDPGNRTQP